MSQKIRQQIIDTLLRSKGVLLTGHNNPDGDSLGSILGLAGMLKDRNIKYQIVNEGTIPRKYLFLPGVDQVKGIDAAANLKPDFDTAVVIECSNLDRIGSVQRLISKACTIINIDHHQDNVLFGKINLREQAASAAGEMIYDILKQGNSRINKEMATSLYTAILTDTGRFHYNNTTPHCLRVAAELVELGADPCQITEQIYYRQTRARLLLTGIVLSNMDYLADGQLCVMTIDLEMMRKTEAQNGDTEGMVNYSLAAAGVEVGALFSEIDDKTTKVSLRSQDRIDVAAIAAHYGGGGHHNASGFTVRASMAEAKQEVIKYIKDRLDGSI